MFLHDPANADFAKEFLGSHISADMSEQVRAGYIQGALTVLSADFSRKDLERWIAIDFKGGVITQRDAGRRRVRRRHAGDRRRP